MMPIKIDILFISAKTVSELAQGIRAAIASDRFVSIDPFSPWYAEGMHHVILTLTLEDPPQESQPQRYR